jgi:hypothetical protein
MRLFFLFEFVVKHQLDIEVNVLEGWLHYVVSLMLDLFLVYKISKNSIITITVAQHTSSYYCNSTNYF